MADIKQDCNELRAQIQALADAVKGLKRHEVIQAIEGGVSIFDKA